MSTQDDQDRRIRAIPGEEEDVDFDEKVGTFFDHLKASQAKVMTLKETPRMEKTPSGIGMTGRHVVARLLQQESQEWERPPISFATVFLYVLLSVSVLVLVLALLLYAATMLR